MRSYDAACVVYDRCLLFVVKYKGIPTLFVFPLRHFSQDDWIPGNQPENWTEHQIYVDQCLVIPLTGFVNDPGIEATISVHSPTWLEPHGSTIEVWLHSRRETVTTTDKYYTLRFDHDAEDPIVTLLGATGLVTFAPQSRLSGISKAGRLVAKTRVGKLQQVHAVTTVKGSVIRVSLPRFDSVSVDRVAIDYYSSAIIVYAMSRPVQRLPTTASLPDEPIGVPSPIHVPTIEEIVIEYYD